jgi:hypothetical protein
MLLRRRERHQPAVEGQALSDERLHQRLGHAQRPIDGDRGHLQRCPHPGRSLSADLRQKPGHGTDPPRGADRGHRQLRGEPPPAARGGNRPPAGARRHDLGRPAKRAALRRDAAAAAQAGGSGRPHQRTARRTAGVHPRAGARPQGAGAQHPLLHRDPPPARSRARQGGAVFRLHRARRRSHGHADRTRSSATRSWTIPNARRRSPAPWRKPCNP